MSRAAPRLDRRRLVGDDDHMPLLTERDNVEFAAVCRLDVELLRSVQEHFGFPFPTGRYEELLEQDFDAPSSAPPPPPLRARTGGARARAARALREADDVEAMHRSADGGRPVSVYRPQTDVEVA
jgi:hypothetical protein